MRLITLTLAATAALTLAACQNNDTAETSAEAAAASEAAADASAAAGSARTNAGRASGETMSPSTGAMAPTDGAMAPMAEPAPAAGANQTDTERRLNPQGVQAPAQ